MTTPLILNLTLQYQILVACVYHCQYTSQSKFFRTQTVSKLKEFKWQLKTCWFWGGPKGNIVSFGTDSKCMLEPPKGSVLFGKGLARTPSHTARADIAYSRERDNLSVHEQQETVELTSFKLFCHTGKKACGSMFCLCICSGSHLTCSG